MKYGDYSCGYSTVEIKIKNQTDLMKLYSLNEYQKSFTVRATFKVELIDTFNINIKYCIPSDVALIMNFDLNSFNEEINKALLGKSADYVTTHLIVMQIIMEKFIEKANKIHHNKYDYSLVDYKNYQEEVQIICPRHGAFPQKPNSHLQGSGCSKCKIESQTLSKEEFIKRANEIHGDGIYDYTHVDYQGYDENVQIICSKHGPFSQTHANHLNGKGCSKCAWEKLANERKMTLEEFIEEANKIHGEGTYDYSKVDYKNYKTEVIIICPKHGDFPQTPASHLKGCGCRKCNKNIGENAIRNFLTKNNIEFEEQKKFEGCKYKRQLRFDFYIPKYNLCIESDGIPHFEKVNWNGKMTNEEMEKLLKSNQFRDKIKNDYCKKNGIILLRVNNLKAVEELSKYFQYYKINFNL